MAEPRDIEPQPREHAVLCARCREHFTWHWAGVCAACVDRELSELLR